ncbi:CGNR zinc finger domain-containing protein [Nonomuraea sp. KM90]|uniref:CGNR zinc finger domain-containing protein n=1 Tax=Nonomuraea sp. KM90 TaxID=3457428 RepID=UPI003FCC415D
MRQFGETGLVAIDLANTWDEYLDDPERLPDVAALRRFCAELDVPGAPGGDERESVTPSASDGGRDGAGSAGGSGGGRGDAGSAGASGGGQGGAGSAGGSGGGRGEAGEAGSVEEAGGGRREGGEAGELEAVRGVRGRLREVLSGADAQARTRALARWAAELPLRATVVDSDGTPVLRLAAPEGAPLGERLAVRAVTELLDLAVTGDWERLRLCAARPCQDAFVDRSRPGRRQFCSTRCANRAHAAASRARHR